MVYQLSGKCFNGIAILKFSFLFVGSADDVRMKKNSHERTPNTLSKKYPDLKVALFTFTFSFLVCLLPNYHSIQSFIQ